MLLSLRTRNEAAMERAFAQLSTYYNDTRYATRCACGPSIHLHAVDVHVCPSCAGMLARVCHPHSKAAPTAGGFRWPPAGLVRGMSHHASWCAF